MVEGAPVAEGLDPGGRHVPHRGKDPRGDAEERHGGRPDENQEAQGRQEGEGAAEGAGAAHDGILAQVAHLTAAPELAQTRAKFRRYRRTRAERPVPFGGFR